MKNLKHESQHENNEARKQDRQGWQERVGPLLNIVQNRGAEELKKTKIQNRRIQARSGILSDVLYGEVPGFLYLRSQRHRMRIRHKQAV